MPEGKKARTPAEQKELERKKRRARRLLGTGMARRAADKLTEREKERRKAAGLD